MEIKLTIEDIDYDSLADRMMPLLLDHFSKDKDDVLARLVMLSQGFTESAVKTILSRMSQKQKDYLLIKMVNTNKPKILKLLTEMALTQGFKMNIKNVEAKE